MIRSVTKALPWLLLLPAIAPLIYVDGMLYPYLALKTIVFRALGLCALAGTLFLLLSERPLYWERLRQKITWIPGALLGVAYITSAFGIDFYHSFWSIFDRGDGLLTFTLAIVYFYTALLFADAKLTLRLMRWIAWASSIVALYASLQWVQGVLGMNIPLIAEPNGRYGGTLGNAAFLAAYLGMTFFVTLIAAREARKRNQTLLFVGAGLQLFAIFISATRGTLLALIVVAGIALFALAWKGEGKGKTYGRAGVALLALFAGLFFGFKTELAQSSFEPVRRIASISVTEGTVSSRLFVWEHMWDEGMKSPTLGVGAEHVDILFNRFYDPTGIEEQWFDRSHNAYLDYFVQYGIFGVLLYLALILAFARSAAVLYQKGDMRGALLFLAILTYALQNFFVFDTGVTLWLLLILFAALLVLENDVKEVAWRIKTFPYLPQAVAIAVLLLIIPVSFQPLRANLALAEGYRYHIVDVRKAVAAMEHGLSLGTYADLEYGYQAYEMYTERQTTMLSGEARLIAYRYAADVLAANYSRYLYDARTATYYAHVLDSAPPEISINEELLRKVLAHAIELSPMRIQPYYLLANISLKKGDALPMGSAERARYYEEGIAELANYSSVVPKLAEPRYAIATLYVSLGDMEAAKEWADGALPLYKTDYNVARRAAGYYLTIEDWETAARFLEDAVRETQNGPDYPLEYDLAKVKWLGGDKAGAREIVERIRLGAPGLFESDPAFAAEYTAAE